MKKMLMKMDNEELVATYRLLVHVMEKRAKETVLPEAAQRKLDTLADVEHDMMLDAPEDAVNEHVARITLLLTLSATELETYWKDSGLEELDSENDR